VRLLGLAVFGVSVVLITGPAAGQETLFDFLDRERDDGVYTLECFQAGHKVMWEKSLRIDRQPNRMGGKRLIFVDQNGRSINIVQSADLACIIIQTSK